MPAAMPRTAKPVVTVDETLMLSKGKSPVTISQTPSNVNPRFLPAKLVVSAMRSSFLNRPIELNNLIPLQTLRPIQDDRDLAASGFRSGQDFFLTLAPLFQVRHPINNKVHERRASFAEGGDDEAFAVGCNVG